MNIYISHNFASREWLKEFVIPFFERLGHKVTSSWITDDKHLDPSYLERAAMVDLEDIEKAGTIILFAEQYGATPGRGKYIELGYAIRAGKICIVVDAKGDNSCVFYQLPTIRRARDLEEVLKFLC